MMMWSRFSLLLVVASTTVAAFSSGRFPSFASTSHARSICEPRFSATRNGVHFGLTSAYQPSPLILMAGPRSKENEKNLPSAQVDGSDRGAVLQTIVLAVCVWIFSIPPEFRRAHFCTVDACIADRSKCYDCVTLKEWTSDIRDYYRNGGGIQFDFTVAEETKQFWKDSISGN